MENVGIKKYIDKRLSEIESEKVADQQEVIEYLTRLMRGEEKETEMIIVGNFVQELVEVPVIHVQRMKAAELIGKRYSMWTDKQEVDLSQSITFVDDFPLDDDD